MKRVSFIILLVVFASFDGSDQKRVVENDEQLIGSWKMVSYRYGNDSIFREVPIFTKFVKHLTKSHFTWVSYQEDGNMIVGAGGGTYRTDGETYTENIEFFHPVGTGIIGTSVDFNYRTDGRKWFISGWVKSVQFDPKTGKYDLVDSTKLEENWLKIY